MPVVRGKDFKLYRNTDDPYDDIPTWSEVTNVRDLTRNRSKALADASTRASSYRMQVPTLKELGFEFQMVYDPTDIDVIAFEDAYEEDTLIELVSLDGPIDVDGSKGVRFMGEVSDFTINEALEDVGLVDVTLVVGYAPDNLPRRVVVEGGELVDAAEA